MSAHVVVVGGGAAGCLAALSAKKHGASVTLVSRSAGATALSTGSVSTDGVADAPVSEPERREALGHLGRVAELVEADDEFLLNSGARLRCTLPSRNHAGGGLASLVDRSVCVVGIPGLAAFNAAYLARVLGDRSIRARHVDVVLEGVKRTFDLTSFPVARALDDTSLASRWVEAVAREVSTLPTDVVALPPVMGLQNHRAIRKLLDETLEIPWFETLASPPSVPGMRLWLNLNQYVRDEGVTLLHSEVKNVVIRGDVVVELRAWDGETSHRLQPDQVVLATGRYITGGIVLGEQATEALMGLPVTGRLDDEHARQEVGVRTGEDLLCVDEQGRVVLRNVRVAGTVRAGGAYASGTGGIGLAAVTGWAAGARGALAHVEVPRGAPQRTVEALPRAGEEGCLGCEMCASVCPVLERATLEGPWYPGPRALTGLARSGPLLQASGDPLSLCTLCGACSAICPAGGRNFETVASLRSRLLAEFPEDAPESHRAIPEVLQNSGNVYGLELEPLEGPRSEDAEIAFFPGCSLAYFERESAGNTIGLLEALQIPFSLVDGACCGGPLDVLGLQPPPEAIEINRRGVQRTGAKLVVATCPRCTHRLSRDLDLPGVKVEHTLELLDRILPGSSLLERLREKLAGQVVTYHDPCETGRYRGMYDEARRILALVGVQVVEMARSRERSVCCGAGGGLRAANTRLSREISRRRVVDAVQTGADHLLTECPSCLHNLRTGRKRRQKIGVEDLTGFLGAALK